MTHHHSRGHKDAEHVHGDPASRSFVIAIILNAAFVVAECSACAYRSA